MFKKILLATDGSEDALRAADYALELAKKNEASVEIMYVLPMIPVFGPEKALYHSLAANEDLKAHGQEVLADTLKKFEAQNIPCETKIVQGDPADLICEEAKEKGVSLIIIGTRGMTGVTRWVMGSVSSKVVNHAPCSVLVIR